MTFFESKPRCQNVTKLAIYIKPYFNTLQLLMLENPTGKSYLINGISDMTFLFGENGAFVLLLQLFFGF